MTRTQGLSHHEHSQGAAHVVEWLRNSGQGEELGEVASHASEVGLEPVEDRELEKG